MAEPAEETDHALKAALALSEGLKKAGNDQMKAGAFSEAVRLYSEALQLDDESAVLFSNRSAAFLSMGNARGKALSDARECVRLADGWWKSHLRLGNALHALGRYDQAIQTYYTGLRLDPGNQSLLNAIEDARKDDEAHSQKLREYAKEKEKEEAKRREIEEERQKAAKAEEDLLASFMSEVKEIEDDNNCTKKVVTKQPINFGNADDQIARLLKPHFKWINLNPFEVLQLDVNDDEEITEEDIKQHYRKLSTLVHPDKCLNNPNAREAFEEVNKAYQLLQTEDKKKLCIRTIQTARMKAEKERRIQLKKGYSENDLGSLDDAKRKAVMKAFAEIEHRRANIEKREAKQRDREARQEEDEKEKIMTNVKHEKAWAEEGRREKRVGGWRHFQKDGDKKLKTEAHGWKKDESVDKKTKGAHLDEYKKNWK